MELLPQEDPTNTLINDLLHKLGSRSNDHQFQKNGDSSTNHVLKESRGEISKKPGEISKKTGEISKKPDAPGRSTPVVSIDAKAITDAAAVETTAKSPPSVILRLSRKAEVMETVISNMFSTISSLKNAYIKLQSAHVPYDPEKIQSADRVVINELKRLSELKHSYIESIANLDIDEQLQPMTNKGTPKSFESVISNLESEIQKQKGVIENLKETLDQTSLKKEKLERRLKRLEQRAGKDGIGNSVVDSSSLTPQLLESVVLAVSDASRSFGKLMISHIRTAQWDLDAAANAIEPGAVYTRRTHKKFAFESYINRRMLNGFQTKDFLVSSGVDPVVLDKQQRQEYFKEFQEFMSVDPSDVVNTNPKGAFGKYCLEKFVNVIHLKMEESFFGNVNHRKQISAGTHPQTQFYKSFLKLAKAMWLLHRLSLSFEPSAQIFEAEGNVDFSPLYMESIVQMAELDTGSKQKVAFTVMPGFRVSKTLIKCQVYISATGCAEPVQG